MVHSRQPGLVCFLGVTLAACGASSAEIDRVTDGEASSASAQGGDADRGSQVPTAATVDPDPEPVCMPGETRAATPGEFAATCDCTDARQWYCYGVSAERQIGGTTKCNSRLRSGQQEPCSLTISDCQDSRTYAVMCNVGCVCVVNATVVGELARDAECPASVEAVNHGCGWKLNVKSD